MRKLFIALLAAVTLACGSPIDRAKNSLVRITGIQARTFPFHEISVEEPYSCTGFVIKEPNLVLTANHCVGESMLGDGKKVTLIRGDKYYDLALLAVEGLRRPALLLREEPVQEGELLKAIGYAEGYTHLSTLDIKVMIPLQGISNEEASGVITQGGFIEGMSGGPQLDASGRIVGVIQQNVFFNAGYGVDAVLVRAFLHDTGVDLPYIPRVN
jgi:S1-C subfamily serine protease